MPVPHNTPTAIIPSDVLDRILNRLPKDQRQGRRLIAMLGSCSKVPAIDVHCNCSISNISNIAKQVRPYLLMDGFMVGCDYPDVKLRNQFGEESDQYLWSMYYANMAANDAHDGVQ